MSATKLVFRGPHGGALSRSDLSRDVHKAVLEDAAPRGPVRLHDLRHTAAASWLAAGHLWSQDTQGSEPGRSGVPPRRDVCCDACCHAVRQQSAPVACPMKTQRARGFSMRRSGRRSNPRWLVELLLDPGARAGRSKLVRTLRRELGRASAPA